MTSARLRPLFAAAMLCAAGASALAVPVAYDGFDYPVGNLAGNSGGTGWTGAWAADPAVDVVTNANLIYSSGNVVVVGGPNAAQVTGLVGNPTPLDNAASRPFTGQTGPVYMSLLFQPVVNGGTGQDDFFQFMLNDDTDAENSGAIGMRNQTGTAGNDGYFTRIRNNSADSNAEAAPNVTSLVGRTDFLVGKFSKVANTDYNRFDLFVNPTSNVEGVPSASLTFDSDMSMIDFFSLRLAFIDTGDAYRFDELRIGTEFADVVTILPEPATAALGVLGAMMLGLRRRRA